MLEGKSSEKPFRHRSTLLKGGGSLQLGKPRLKRKLVGVFTWILRREGDKVPIRGVDGLEGKGDVP